MRNTAALFCAVMFVSGCAILPEPTMQRPVSRDDQEPSDPMNVFYSRGPLDFELAMQGFRPPTGAASFAWETPLERFHGRLQPLPVTASSYYSPGKVLDLNCRTLAECIRYPMKAVTEGEGTYAMAEYWNPKYSLTVVSSVTAPNGTTTPEVQIRLYPALFMMCGSRDLSLDITRHLSLCGKRMYFVTETLEQITKTTDPGWASRYHHMLVWLVRQFGAPSGYTDCVKVTITTPDEVIQDKRRSKRCAPLRTWSWCPPRMNRISSYCPASVTLAYDPRLSRGVVIFATRRVWHFAHAQWESGGDPSLHEILHELAISPASQMPRHRGRGTCDWSLWGCPGTLPLTEREIELYRIPPAAPGS